MQDHLQNFILSSFFEWLTETWLLLSCGSHHREHPWFHSEVLGNQGPQWCIKLDSTRFSPPNQTQHTWGDCPSSSQKSLSEQWHHCRVVCLWHYQICDEDWIKKKKVEEWWREWEHKTKMERGMHWQRQQQFQRERGNKREKASSCGLAELTVNLCRFIFSGACCSLKGGQIYMPLPGLLWRGPEDGISGLRGWDGGFFAG